MNSENQQRYQALKARYGANWPLAIEELFGLALSEADRGIVDAVSKNESRPVEDAPSVSLDLSIGIGLCLFLLDEHVTIIVAANNRGRTKGVVADLWTHALEAHNWLAEEFSHSAAYGFVRAKDSLRSLQCYGYQPGNEEVLAGWSDEKLSFVTNGWSAMSESAQACIKGSLRTPANRLVNF